MTGQSKPRSSLNSMVLREVLGAHGGAPLVAELVECLERHCCKAKAYIERFEALRDAIDRGLAIGVTPDQIAANVEFGLTMGQAENKISTFEATADWLESTNYPAMATMFRAEASKLRLYVCEVAELLGRQESVND